MKVKSYPPYEGPSLPYRLRSKSCWVGDMLMQYSTSHALASLRPSGGKQQTDTTSSYDTPVDLRGHVLALLSLPA